MASANGQMDANRKQPMTNGSEASWRRHRATRALVISTAFLALAIAGCGGGSRSTTTSPRSPARAIPVAVSATQLRTIAGSAGHPIYWAGTAAGTYELTRIADGRTYVRYLPPGVAVWSARHFLTIGTYVRAAPPYATIRSAALAKHATIKALKGGELAVQYGARPQSVYLTFPGARYEVDVYDPSAATAMRLRDGREDRPDPLNCDDGARGQVPAGAVDN
jgi:hypothetical protein